MQNQMMKNKLYESIKMSEDELMHHGILGMHWGIRRYQDYGEGGYDPDHEGRFVGERISKKEMKAQAEKEKRLRKMRVAAAKKRKAEAKAAKKQEKIDKMKSELIQKGDLDKILKKREYFTNEELEYARQRNQELINTRYEKNFKKAPDPHAMDKLLNLVSRVGQVAAAAVPVLDAVSKYKNIQQTDLNMRLSEMRAQDDAMKSKIDVIKGFNPKAAAEYASRVYGSDIEYNPEKKDKKSPADVRTIAETLGKFDKNAASRFLRDQTGYDVRPENGSTNIGETKKVKGKIEDFNKTKLGGKELEALLKRKITKFSEKASDGGSSIFKNSDRYVSNTGVNSIGISDSAKNSIMSLFASKSGTPVSSLNGSSGKSSSSQYSFNYDPSQITTSSFGSFRRSSGSPTKAKAMTPSDYKSAWKKKQSFGFGSTSSSGSSTKAKAMTPSDYKSAWKKKRTFL